MAPKSSENLAQQRINTKVLGKSKFISESSTVMVVHSGANEDRPGQIGRLLDDSEIFIYLHMTS